MTYDDDDLTRRLQDLGARPLDPALASGHLTALAAVVPRRRWATRLKIAGAFAAGLLLGGTGLASAGALPEGAQEVAYRTLGQVGIDVPPGKQRYNDPAACPGGPYRNHGEYVREHPDDPDAGKSPCGKPIKSVEKDKTAKTDGDHPRGKAKGKTKDKSKGENKAEEGREDGSNDPSPPATTESTLTPGSDPPTTTSTTTTSSTTTSSTTTSSTTTDSVPHR